MNVFSNEVLVENTVPVTGSVSVDNFPATQPVSGSVSVSNFPATQPVSGSVTVSGTVTANVPSSSSSTVAQVTSTASNQTLIAANANRKKVILNFTTGVWHVKYGATASATSRTIFVNNTAYTLSEETWKGQIDALCTTSGKVVDVTELI